MEIVNLELVLEHTDDMFFGRTLYNDNLITESAKSIGEVEQLLKETLFDLEGLNTECVKFYYTYDVYSLFAENEYLNITKLADSLGINASLLRQYASGIKNPSKEQVEKIELGIKKIGQKLVNTSLS